MTLLLTAFSLNAVASINWVSYKDAFKKAQKENKLVMIYIYSDECHYCKEMEQTTFKDKEVIQTINRYFVPVKVEKKTKDAKEVIKKYGYLGTPTFHFVDKDGKKLKSIFGAWKKEDFLKILGYFYSQVYKTKTMTEYFMEN